MSIYKVPLRDYNLDYIRMPVLCGGYNLLFEFSWDTVAQKHYDDVKGALKAYATANPLVLISNTNDIVPNTDFSDYVLTWNQLILEFEEYVGRWLAVLLYSPETLDWSTFQTETEEYQDSFSSKYISFNHISKLKDFLVYIQSTLTAITGEDVTQCIYLLQNIPEDMHNYISQYLEYVQEADRQLADLEELLYWMVTVHYGEDSRTTALEVGSQHFDQDPVFPGIFFESPRDKIGLRDMGYVTLWIGIKDGSQ